MTLHTPISGKIFLLSAGPGDLKAMSVHAKEALTQAQVVIGYRPYLQLCQSLLHGQQQILAYAMTEEALRCTVAYEYALKGCTVALVSSGDIGIYGLASLAYEVFLAAGWTPASNIAVELIPGITALSAAAALAGAPLGHDFCAISLSDLLTPWSVIAKRLHHAAQADLVIALYNPKSQKRRQQIEQTRHILLRHRHLDTPVAIVTHAYRSGQHIVHTTLTQLDKAHIDMHSLVIIGNQSSYVQAGLMLTPRGYQAKYDLHTQTPHNPAQRRGHPLPTGLDGVRTHILQALQQGNESLEALSLRLQLSLADLLTLLCSTDATTMPALQIAQVNPSLQTEALYAACHWGPIRLRIGHLQTLCTSMSAPALHIHRRAHILHLEVAALTLALPITAIQQAWFICQPAYPAGLYLLDATGACMLSLHPDTTTPVNDTFWASWNNLTQTQDMPLSC